MRPFLALAALSLSRAEVGCYLEHNVSMDAVTGDALTVHIVAHTHDDPGWLITVDEYYIQEVEWIFYTMIPVLKDNPERRFTYVEMAYMHRWWEEIDNHLKKETVDLVNSDQYQINLGGWCMNDEASPTASAVIHQMTDGNQFVLSNLGLKARPTVAWHVDPFGHSWVTGGLWAQSGFDAFAVHRINYMDLEKRKAAQNLEFIWKGSSTLGEDGYIFFHVLDSGYCSPSEINFWDGGSWINTDPLLPSYPPNAIELGEKLVADARTRSAWYKHDQVLIPFGCDFAHQNAYQSMLQMDKLIEYVNSNATYNVTMVYSTLADYIDAVNAKNLSWSLEQPDFFTYVDSPHAWWSGYFTSRAYLKLFVRSRMNVLRVSEMLYFFAKNMNLKADYKEGMANITFLRDAVDVVQHHDAVTGTEKHDVADEYMNQLEGGTQRVNAWDQSVVGEFLKGPTGKTPTLVRGDSQMENLTPDNFIVLVAFNSLAWNVSEMLRIPTNRSDLVVYDRNNNFVASQINPVADQEQNAKYPATYNLFIWAENMAPLSFETFFIGVASTDHPATLGEVKEISPGQSVSVGSNGYYSLEIDGATQRLSSITNNDLGKTFAVEQQFSQYVPSGGIYNDGYIASGAYIFRPATDNRLRLDSNNNGANQNRKVTVVFRQPLPKTASPGFIVQTHSNYEQYVTDTFSATVCNVNLNANPPIFEYQYFRADGGDTWGQSPLFDFLVFDTNDASYSALVDGQQTGIVQVAKPAGSATYTSVVITFPRAFATNDKPLLFVSVRNAKCDGSQFATTITTLTSETAEVLIQRVDVEEPWQGAVSLDWLAFAYDDIDASDVLTVAGEAKVSVNPGTKTVSNVSVEFGNEADFFVVNEPVILTSIQTDQASNSGMPYFFSSTTFDNSNVSFNMNLFPEDPSALPDGAQLDLTVRYIAFERRILFSNVTADAQIKNTIVSGPLMDEVQQTFRDGYGQTLRVFNIEHPDLRFIDNRVQIGPIDQGAEFITKFSTSLRSNGEFFTNQAGLEYVPRSYYPFWDERVAGNYYPSSGATYITDGDNDVDDVRFSTIVDQGHGVGSLRDGELELMLQRRCLQDDSRGVAQVLNETYHTEPQIMLLLDTAENVADLNRRYYQLQQFQHSFFFGVTESISDYTTKYATAWSAMNEAMPNGLPDNVFLLQLRYAYSGSTVGDNGGMVMQLQNMFEEGESAMAKEETVDITKVLKPDVLVVRNSTEMNLLATIPLAEMQRLPWNIESEEGGEVYTIRDELSEQKRRSEQRFKDKASTVQLKPRDIKTFVINVSPDVPQEEEEEAVGARKYIQ